MTALLTAVTALSLTGCGGSAYDLYKNAELKTDEATTGIYNVDISINNEFDTSQMTEEQLKAVNYMKQVAFKGTNTVDKTQDALISDAWINLGGIGFDFTYYAQGDKQYIKYPVLKKYIDIKQMAATALAGKGGTSEMPGITKESQEQLFQIWDKLASKDTVKSIEDVIIPTSQGDIKAKHLIIDVDGAVIKQALMDSQKVLLADEQLKKMMAEQMKSAGVTESGQVQFISPDMTIDSFEISSYIDADGYLVKDEVSIVMGNFDKGSALKSSSFHLATIYSQLNQKVNLQFPTITPDQVFTSEELNKDMPAVFKDLIK